MIHFSGVPFLVRFSSRLLVAFCAALSVGFLAFLSLSAFAHASDEEVVEISIKDHKFLPDEIKLPAAKPVKITVKNLDPSAEEFESSDLGFEKIIAGNSNAIIRLKPLDPGTYIFFGEYHMDSALGHIIVE